MVTVFTKSSCHPCRLTKRALEIRGIDYVERRVDQDPEALAEIKELGYLQVPVVVAADGSHWSGLQPDRINALAA